MPSSQPDDESVYDLIADDLSTFASDTDSIFLSAAEQHLHHWDLSSRMRNAHAAHSTPTAIHFFAQSPGLTPALPSATSGGSDDSAESFSSGTNFTPLQNSPRQTVNPQFVFDSPTGKSRSSSYSSEAHSMDRPYPLGYAVPQHGPFVAEHLAPYHMAGQPPYPTLPSMGHQHAYNGMPWIYTPPPPLLEAPMLQSSPGYTQVQYAPIPSQVQYGPIGAEPGLNGERQSSERQHTASHSPSEHDVLKREGSDRSSVPDDEGDYVCHVCEPAQAFNTEHNLRFHMATHDEKRPFSCETCGTIFKRMADLNRHTRAVHEKQMTDMCEYCGRRFPRKDSLTRHVTKSCAKRGLSKGVLRSKGSPSPPRPRRNRKPSASKAARRNSQTASTTHASPFPGQNVFDPQQQQHHPPYYHIEDLHHDPHHAHHNPRHGGQDPSGGYASRGPAVVYTSYPYPAQYPAHQPVHHPHASHLPPPAHDVSHPHPQHHNTPNGVPREASHSRPTSSHHGSSR